jgi:hypothetical protein
MRLLLLLLVAAVPIAPNAVSQGLSPAEKKIVDSARSRYYSLDGQGFISATCSVKFEFSTVPILPSVDSLANLKLLEATQFTLMLDRNGPTLQHKYPDGTADDARRRAEPEANLLSSLVQGLFLTWPTKGLNGPIPAFDSQIKSAVETNDGFRLILSVPGGPVRIELNKDYLVTEIVSIGGKIEERPEYMHFPEGLVFTGNTATDNSESSGSVNVKYELESSMVDGLRLPTSAQLQVSPNIDVKFALNECTVTKGSVVSVQPPKAADAINR